jgi:hypothetical protein
LRDYGVVGQHCRVRCYRSHLGESAQPQPVVPRLDGCMICPQRRDVHDALGGQDVELHEINKRCSSREELDRRVRLALAGLLSEASGLRQVDRAVISERPHQACSICSRACLIAVTILG